MGAASDMSLIVLSEDKAGGLGLLILIGIVAIAVALFLTTGNRSKEFEYLEKESIETEYGVKGFVKERKEKFSNTYSTCNIIGTMLCILS